MLFHILSYNDTAPKPKYFIIATAYTMTTDDSAIVTPVKIEPLAEELVISWSNQDKSVYKYRDLRFQCPCALCVDENTGKRVIKLASVHDDTIIVDWIFVGRYALQFLWSDAHETGIYPYTMLLRLGDKAPAPPKTDQ